MSITLKIVVAKSSAIIRSGLEMMLKKLSGMNIKVIEADSADKLLELIRHNQPDLLIINPAFPGCFSLQQIKDESRCPDIKCLALIYSLMDQSLLRGYDDQINIYDSTDEIRHKLERLHEDEANESATDEQLALSTREKEIVVCVVKGMTNREIADRLYLSTHTVITHRRNIARKLQIHSASGLTVYAIVNKLVELDEIKT